MILPIFYICIFNQNDIHVGSCFMIMPTDFQKKNLGVRKLFEKFISPTRHKICLVEYRLKVPVASSRNLTGISYFLVNYIEGLQPRVDSRDSEEARGPDFRIGN